MSDQTTIQKTLVFRFFNVLFSAKGHFNVELFEQTLDDKAAESDMFKRFLKATQSNVSRANFDQATKDLLHVYKTRHETSASARGVSGLYNRFPHQAVKGLREKDIPSNAVGLVKEPYKMMRNVDLSPLLRKTFEQSGAFVSSSHGIQKYHNLEAFVVPKKVVVVQMVTMGLSMTVGHSKRVFEALHDAASVEQLCTNPVWRRRSTPEDDVFRNRVYSPEGTKMRDMMLRYQDDTDLSSGVYAVKDGKDVKLPSFINDYRDPKQQPLNLLYKWFPKNTFDDNGDMLDTTSLSAVARKLSAAGGGVLIVISCRNSPLHQEAKIGNIRRIEKRQIYARRVAKDKEDARFIGNFHLTKTTGIKLCLKQDPIKYETINKWYASVLLFAYHLGPQVSKRFNGWVHTNMYIENNRLHFTRERDRLSNNNNNNDESFPGDCSLFINGEEPPDEAPMFDYLNFDTTYFWSPVQRVYAKYGKKALKTLMAGDLLTGGTAFLRSLTI